MSGKLTLLNSAVSGKHMQGSVLRQVAVVEQQQMVSLRHKVMMGPNIGLNLVPGNGAGAALEQLKRTADRFVEEQENNRQSVEIYKDKLEESQASVRRLEEELQNERQENVVLAAKIKEDSLQVGYIQEKMDMVSSMHDYLRCSVAKLGESISQGEMYRSQLESRVLDQENTITQMEAIINASQEEQDNLNAKLKHANAFTEALSKAMQESKSAVSDLEATVNILNDKMKNEKQLYEENVQSLQSNLGTQLRSLQKCQIEIGNLEENLKTEKVSHAETRSNLKEKIMILERDREEGSKALEEATRKLHAADEKIKTQQQTLQTEMATRRKLEEQVCVAEAVSSKRKDQIEEQSAKVRELESEISGMKESFDAVTVELEKNRLELADSYSNLAKKDQELTNIQIDLCKSAETIKIFELKNADQASKLLNEQVEVKRLNEEHQTLQSNIVALTGQVDGFEKEIKRLSVILEDEQELKRKTDLELERATERLSKSVDECTKAMANEESLKMELQQKLQIIEKYEEEKAATEETAKVQHEEMMRELEAAREAALSNSSKIKEAENLVDNRVKEVQIAADKKLQRFTERTAKEIEEVKRRAKEVADAEMKKMTETLKAVTSAKAEVEAQKAAMKTELQQLRTLVEANEASSSAAIEEVVKAKAIESQANTDQMMADIKKIHAQELQEVKIRHEHDMKELIETWKARQDDLENVYERNLGSISKELETTKKMEQVLKSRLEAQAEDYYTKKQQIEERDRKLKESDSKYDSATQTISRLSLELERLKTKSDVDREKIFKDSEQVEKQLEESQKEVRQLNQRLEQLKKEQDEFKDSIVQLQRELKAERAELALERTRADNAALQRGPKQEDDKKDAKQEGEEEPRNENEAPSSAEPPTRRRSSVFKNSKRLSEALAVENESTRPSLSDSSNAAVQSQEQRRDTKRSRDEKTKSLPHNNSVNKSSSAFHRSSIYSSVHAVPDTLPSLAPHRTIGSLHESSNRLPNVPNPNTGSNVNSHTVEKNSFSRKRRMEEEFPEKKDEEIISSDSESMTSSLASQDTATIRRYMEAKRRKVASQRKQAMGSGEVSSHRTTAGVLPSNDGANRKEVNPAKDSPVEDADKGDGDFAKPSISMFVRRRKSGQSSVLQSVISQAPSSHKEKQKEVEEKDEEEETNVERPPTSSRSSLFQKKVKKGAEEKKTPSNVMHEGRNPSARSINDQSSIEKHDIHRNSGAETVKGVANNAKKGTDFKESKKKLTAPGGKNENIYDFSADFPSAAFDIFGNIDSYY